MKSPSAKESQYIRFARQAMTLMIERNIEPTPINYAVWFHYAAGDRKELTSEINQLLQKKSLHISDDVNIYLYNKYVTPPAKDEEPTAQTTSQNAQVVLAEIMGVIEKFGGDTATYNKEIDEQVTHLSKTITDPALKAMATEIINRAVAIRNSGTALHTKLEESKREVVQLKTNLEKATNDANKDFLTGTANRKALEARMDELTKWSKESNGDLCLLMIDIDHFKKFNDKFGHLVGDEVLRKVGKALFDSIKGKDFVARYGGEEFAVLLPSTPLAAALIVGENIRKNISETELLRKDTGASIGGVTISIGVARYRPEADSVPMLIGRADDALYRSKIGGRNRVTPESFEKEQ